MLGSTFRQTIVTATTKWSNCFVACARKSDNQKSESTGDKTPSGPESRTERKDP
jgi:hypothetical protein